MKDKPHSSLHLTGRHCHVLLFLLGLASLAANSHAQPVIVTQPEGHTNCAGETVTFSVSADGTPPLSYQWRERINLVFTDLPGETNASFVLVNVQQTPRVFDVIVANDSGSVTSALARLYVNWPVGITRQPTNATVEAGLTFTASVTVSNTLHVKYQWYFNGQALEGRTGNTLMITNVQPSDAGEYWVVAANACGAANSQVATLTVVSPGSTFTQIANVVSTNDPGNHWGSSWVDYDNDGDVDLMICYGFPSTNTKRLFRNLGDGIFERMGSNQVGSIVSDVATWALAAWADLDNDGWLDVYTPAGANSALYQNTGPGFFTRVVDSGLLPATGGGVVWADFDRDGFVDAYCGYGQNLAQSTLYRGDGTGRFTAVTTGPLSRNPGGTPEGVGWTDYDNDGWMDLVVEYPLIHSGGSGTLQYHNEGGVLTEVTNGTLRELGPNALGHIWGDYDNDGLQDVFSVGYGQPSQVLHNDGAGQFHVIPLTLPECFAGHWGDYDNDGDLDLVICVAQARAQFFQNNGDGSFTIITSLNLGDGTKVGQGAWGDYDNDGFLDLVLVPNNFLVANTFLYHNNGTNGGNGNHWLMIKLEGTVANRAAIGAKVRVRATIGGQTVWQVREISRHIRSHDDLRAHFGLGDATNAEIVRVEWPSGQVTEMRDVAVSQILTITESPLIEPLAGAGEMVKNGAFQFELRSHPGMAWDVHASDHLHHFSETCTCSNGYWKPHCCVTNTTGAVIVTDTNVQGAATRFYKAVAR
jgi:hypothetical protein